MGKVDESNKRLSARPEGTAACGGRKLHFLSATTILHENPSPILRPPQKSPTPAVALESVTYRYAGAARRAVVRDVSLAIAPGELAGLIGPNGAGKSTLLKLAAGIIHPQAGRIVIQGTDVRRLTREQLARRVAVVPQDFSVQFGYTVRQVVELGRTAYLSPLGAPRQEDRAAVDEALVTTGSADLADRVFNELSGGERQRVIIALALAQQPAILLLDEPTAHLDIRYQIETLELVRRLNHERGLTVLATMHDLNLAARYFERLILFDGEVVADGAPTRVLAAETLRQVYRTPVRVGILRDDARLSVAPDEPGFPGAPFVIAGMATSDDTPSAAPSHPVAHLIAGGGSGELVMRAFADAGLPFTVGPLNIGDSDQALARRLALTYLAEPPFAPISPEGIAEARAWMERAGAVIVCPAPLGHGNIALLDAAFDALRQGVRVALLASPASMPEDVNEGQAENEAAPDQADATREEAEGQEAGDPTLAAVQARDYSGRGVEAYRALLAAGAVWVRSPAEALAWTQGVAAQPGI